MKKVLSSIVCFAMLCQSGCTVHHHHYYGTTPSAIDGQARAILEDRLAGLNTAIDVITINITNTETPGYKAKRVEFIEGQAQPIVTIDWRPGDVKASEHPFALAIKGDGFFKLDVPEAVGGGVAYTRRGGFFLNRDRELVWSNPDGPRLADGIEIPEDAIEVAISKVGVVTCVFPDQSISDVGQIELHRFLSPDRLKSIDSGMYVETEESGPAIAGQPGEAGLGWLEQWMLEGSNVSLSEQLADLMRLMRQYRQIAAQLDLSASPIATIGVGLND